MAAEPVPPEDVTLESMWALLKAVNKRVDATITPAQLKVEHAENRVARTCFDNLFLGAERAAGAGRSEKSKMAKAQISCAAKYALLQFVFQSICAEAKHLMEATFPHCLKLFKSPDITPEQKAATWAPTIAKFQALMEVCCLLWPFSSCYRTSTFRPRIARLF